MSLSATMFKCLGIEPSSQSLRERLTIPQFNHFLLLLLYICRCPSFRIKVSFLDAPMGTYRSALSEVVVAFLKSLSNDFLGMVLHILLHSLRLEQNLNNFSISPESKCITIEQNQVTAYLIASILSSKNQILHPL